MLPKDINNITEPVYKRLHKEIEDVKESSSAVIEASNITALSDDELNALKVGDVVQKITGEQKHCYIVTYKQEEHGICMSYVAAGYMETVSYDYTDGHWVYNSTDVVEVKDPEAAPSGTIQDVLGLNAGGKLVKGAVSGGTKLYKHTMSGLTEANTSIPRTLELVSLSSNPITLGSYGSLLCIPFYSMPDGSIIYYISAQGGPPQWAVDGTARAAILGNSGTISYKDFKIGSGFTDTVTEL